jgi:hypothetical protein
LLQMNCFRGIRHNKLVLTLDGFQNIIEDEPSYAQ